MSDILERWRAGEGFPDVLVIDGHTHVGDWPHGPNFNSVEEMARGAVAVMDANGVDAACVLSGGHMWQGCDYTIGNDDLIELVSRVPDRLIPFAHVNPNDNLASIRTELDRVYAAGCRCIKLINEYQGNYPGDGPNLMEVYRFASRYGMLVANHHWEIRVLSRLAVEFPTVDFVCAHYWKEQDELLVNASNVYANIWDIGPVGWLERAFKRLGPEKFLFGSDAFMNPMSVGIGPVVYADIPDDHKKMILGLNQSRLLDKVGALPKPFKEKFAL